MLNDEGKTEKAEKVIDRMFELFPNEKMPYTIDSFPATEQYYRPGATEKANEVVKILADNSLESLEYYVTLPNRFAAAVESEQNLEMSLLRNLLILTRRYNQTELNADIDNRLQQLIGKLSMESGS